MGFFAQALGATSGCSSLLLVVFLASVLLEQASAKGDRSCSKKFEDCSHTDCCVQADKGYKCFKKNPYYAGCHKECPKGWDCQHITKSNPDCASVSENCEHLGCCAQEAQGYKCFRHNVHWAQCRKKCPKHWDCEVITEPKPAPMPMPDPAKAEEEVEEKDDGIPKLRATHFWDCNGGGCDSVVLQPWDKKKYIYPPQYAPADPEDYGGSAYGEKLWMTGAASDILSAKMGPDVENCGSSTEGSGGCGQCLIVRNPYAINPNWTAVVMKKNRCPPESPGCHKAHMDFAVPGFDVLHVSLSNVCGDRHKRDETFITKEQSSICGTTPAHSCDCSGIPDDTPEKKMLRKGCELFQAWGWTHGNPLLNYQPVPCPKAFVERVRWGKAFSASGIVTLSSADTPPVEVSAPQLRRFVPLAAAATSLMLFVGAGAFVLRRRRREQQGQESTLLQDGFGPVADDVTTGLQPGHCQERIKAGPIRRVWAIYHAALVLFRLPSHFSCAVVERWGRMIWQPMAVWPQQMRRTAAELKLL
eukprot:CAMPEP_0197920514 /NCGR_PEP_ID=MMETSP1439-20131203/89066_1 /TAXON_ID=66791 /ORGANISM="Gonyaulax spinifera, Strain CCMP409" /LENGTH=528 /DNA_ID=CAMNT_0043542717 /DNA_START=56 /DNA_END=1640 /DNA_ORIENTATION=-